MGRTRGLGALVLTCGLAFAQGAKDWKPALAPGEALGCGTSREGVRTYGEAQGLQPLGMLSRLVWLRLKGTEWEAQGLRFRCTGTWEGQGCTEPKGHGKVDPGKALRDGCTMALLAWARLGVEAWSLESGEGSARLRLQEAFRPFLGDRLPPGEEPPKLDPGWVGEGPLLQGTLRDILEWMLEPAQEGLAQQGRRYFGTLFQDPLGDWWMATGPSGSGTWVLGSNGSAYALLRLPVAAPKAAAVARFKAVLGLK